MGAGARLECGPGGRLVVGSELRKAVQRGTSMCKHANTEDALCRWVGNGRGAQGKRGLTQSQNRVPTQSAQSSTGPQGAAEPLATGLHWTKESHQAGQSRLEMPQK